MCLIFLPATNLLYSITVAGFEEAHAGDPVFSRCLMVLAMCVLYMA